ncbi:MAG: DUF4838 domain-containing protein [Planctomycetes bacterium]|nr:DUF4838 domain-containing protein [Planctomycetota bacterium]
MATTRKSWRDTRGTVLHNPLVLAQDGRSDWSIVVATGAPEPVRHAASELQRFLRQISDAILPVRNDQGSPRPYEILVGPSARVVRLGIPFHPGPLGPDGYVIRSEASRLLIAGGLPRGTLYGVFAFLHDVLGCRWFAPDIQRIPRRRRIAVGPMDETRVPALLYRNFILDGTLDPDWCARNHMNGSCSTAGRQHGDKISHWQFGHSFDALLPPESYFRQHPEYYALVRGRRLRRDTQLCCTHPRVIRLVTDRLRRQIERDLELERSDPDSPSPQVYYLAQNDWGNCCTCASCASLARDQKALSAPILHLCNQVTEQLDREFPEKSILTLAYRFSRKPPRSLRAHPKLIVQLCPIECCQSHPHASCDCADSVSFRGDLEGWRGAADRLWIWDYLANLWHPFVPGPGLHVLGPNLRLFMEHGVSGIFLQDTGPREWRELRAYVMARLLWDPRADGDSVQREFLEAAYGPAAASLEAWTRHLQEEVQSDPVHVRYKAPLCPGYLNWETFRRGEALWRDALEAVARQPEMLERVQKVYAHWQYARIEHEARATLLHRGRLRDTDYVDAKSIRLKKQARHLVAWARRADSPVGNLGAAEYEALIESESVTLENGLLRLVFLPRLEGRLVQIQGRQGGEDACVLTRSTRPGQLAASGYGEQWSGAPGVRDGREGYTCKWDLERLSFETEGFYVHPMQFERWVRLSPRAAQFTVETLVANRGSSEEDSAIEATWPFVLGPSDGLRVSFPAARRRFRLDGPIELSARDAARVLLLEQADSGLGVRLTLKGEGLDFVRIRPRGKSGRVDVTITTRAVPLMPGGGIRLFQMVEIVNGKGKRA